MSWCLKGLACSNFVVSISGCDLKHTITHTVYMFDFAPSAVLSTRQKEIEKTMGNYNAVYTLLWKLDEEGFFRVINENTLQSRKRFSFLNKYILMVFLCPSWMILQSLSMHTAVNDTFYNPSKSSQNCSWLTHTARLRALKRVRGDDQTLQGSLRNLQYPGLV